MSAGAGNSAIVSLVWSKNLRVVSEFVRANPGTVVFSPGHLVTPDAQETIAAAGGKLESFDTLVTDDLRAMLHREIDERQKRLAASLADGEWIRSWLGDPLSPEVIAECLSTEALMQLPQLIMTLGALIKAASGYSIRLVLLNEDLMPMARVVVAWARHNGVPSLHLSHSVLICEPYTVHSRIHADQVAVFGERGLEGYRDVGVDESRLRITGNPAWDDYPQWRARRSEVRAALVARHGLSGERPIIVFGSTWAANLSALGSEDLYGTTLRSFLRACKGLIDQGIALQPVVKDRPQNIHFGQARLNQLLEETGLPLQSVLFSIDDATEWVVAADVLVSVDSNLSIEAMLAGVPAINLVSDLGMFLGPTFAADSGVLDADDRTLIDDLRRLLLDSEFRERQVAAMDRAASSHNAGVDGRATERVVGLMTQMALPDSEHRYPWQTLLDVEAADASQYHNWARTPLFELFSHPPRRVLDIGCGAGATGQALKESYSGVEVFGVEVNHAAAQIAAGRIDHVLEGKFEDIDLEAAGIRPGSLDTVLVADVLEHLYDPWGVLVRLKKYLTPDAQVIASIPNTRNLVLMDELSKGNWRYEPWGLLDVTHIRFFTLREIHRFFHETGYNVSQVRNNLDGRLVDVFNRYCNQPLIDLEFERMTLKNVTPDELGELCTIQFYVRAEPGAVDDEVFERLAGGEKTSDYALWQFARHVLPGEGDLWDSYLRSWPRRPKVHLALLIQKAHFDRVKATLESVSAQLYDGSLLTLVATSPPDGGWLDNDCLHWAQATADESLLAAANRVLVSSGADWVGVIDAGDRLAPHALLFCMDAVVRHVDWRLLYTDEDVISVTGEHNSPHFKPDFNIDMLRSYPYSGGLLLIAGELFKTLGGFDATLGAMEDHDLVLRASEVVSANAIGHVADVMLHRLQEGGRAVDSQVDLHAASRKVLEAHVSRSGIQADMVEGFLPLSWQLRYRHERSAMVSIIVVLRNRVLELQRLVESLIVQTGDLELIVLDAGSSDPRCREYLDSLEGLADSRVRVYRVDTPSSYHACCNLAAGVASGEYLLFIHFDAVPVTADWLSILLAHAQRPDIGVVGPRLLAANGDVRQTGMVLGIDGCVGSAFSGIKLDESGYFGRALVEQNVSAVGGGVFLTRAVNFRELGGFDATLGVGTAEADYCLRLTESDSGLRVLWTPHVSFLCAGAVEGISWTPEAPVLAPEEAMQTRWLHRLGNDPAYNRNLHLGGESVFCVDGRTTLNWDPLPWKPLPRILAKFADNLGCGQYRIIGPMTALVDGGRVQGWADPRAFLPVEIEPLELDAMIFQRQITDEEVDALERHRRHSKVFRVYELDDLLIQLPGRSAHRSHMPVDIGDRLRRAVPMCDRFIVSTEPLAETYRGLNDDIRVVPNFIARARWGALKPLRRQSAKPRVGWIGGAGHTGDLEMIAEVVRELANEVDWVFMGMCPDSLRQHIREFHNGVSFDQYPAKMASLNLDLALAPLEVNPFNEAKSNLRLLEYGALGYPVVCSDIFPYQGDFPVTRVRNRTSDWVQAIRQHVADLDATFRMGDELRAVVEERWMLEDNLDVWLKAWMIR